MKQGLNWAILSEAKKFMCFCDNNDKVVIQGMLLLKKHKKTGQTLTRLELIAKNDIKKDTLLFSTQLSIGEMYKFLEAYRKEKASQGRKAKY